jgi:hypothetical protein
MQIFSGLLFYRPEILPAKINPARVNYHHKKHPPRNIAPGSIGYQSRAHNLGLCAGKLAPVLHPIPL